MCIGYRGIWDFVISLVKPGNASKAGMTTTKKKTGKFSIFRFSYSSKWSFFLEMYLGVKDRVREGTIMLRWQRRQNWNLARVLVAYAHLL